MKKGTHLFEQTGFFEDIVSQRKLISEAKLKVMEWYLLGALFN